MEYQEAKLIEAIIERLDIIIKQNQLVIQIMTEPEQEEEPTKTVRKQPKNEPEQEPEDEDEEEPEETIRNVPAQKPRIKA